jgi:hypothetical protein
MADETSSLTAEQIRLDRMLTRGVVYSIIWLAGLGSCYALYQGIMARRMLRANPALEGQGRAWWCIIAGGIGALTLFAILAIGIFNAAIRP